jgi:predicted component of type VI protein secretion system
MKKLVTAVLLTAALIPATSFAGFENGNGLLAECTAREADNLYYQKNARCMAYISAISDAHDTFVGWGNMEPKFCLPEGVTRGQLKKIVVKDLNENPADLHLTAGSLVSSALYGAFPPSFKDDGTSYCPD